MKVCVCVCVYVCVSVCLSVCLCLSLSLSLFLSFSPSFHLLFPFSREQEKQGMIFRTFECRRAWADVRTRACVNRRV